SDGNDTASSTGIIPVKRLIRESEVLVYAVGIDGESSSTPQWTPSPRPPTPIPFPIPGRRGWPGGRPGGWPPQQPPTGGGGSPRRSQPNDDRVNVVALRDLTDDSGGRTATSRDARAVTPAAAGPAPRL